MVGGIIALFAVAYLMKRKQGDKIIVLLLILGIGVLAQNWQNPVAHLGHDIVQGGAIICALVVLGDFFTKKIEKFTYAFAVALPLFGLAAGGAIGSLFDMIFALNIMQTVTDTLA